MSKYIDASVYAAKKDDDDDWETDGDYVNNVDEKAQRKGGTQDRFQVCRGWGERERRALFFFFLLPSFSSFPSLLTTTHNHTRNNKRSNRKWALRK